MLWLQIKCSYYFALVNWEQSERIVCLHKADPAFKINRGHLSFKDHKVISVAHYSLWL